MPRRRTPRSASTGRADPFTILGLSPDATERDVHEARRRLAKSSHPDAGGSLAKMQQINEAATAAIAAIATRDRPAGRSGPSPKGKPAGSPRSATSGPVRRDHPSFTIEALPAEAFEALMIVASWLGDLIDDDPPYGLELALSEPIGGWCRLDVVPDAGSSTVSVAVAGAPGHPLPSVDDVRDAFVDGLNRLDWSSLDD